jgi:FKBP-type peptidyl-prolyl cis-trans isomerase SlpA
MSNNSIAAHSSVLMHILIRLEDGSIAENTRRSARPSKVVLGDQSISPAFEAQLLGLNVGDKKTFKLAAEDAFGEHLSSNQMTFPINQFAQEIDVTPGTIIEFENKSGTQLLGVVQSVENEMVNIDFNHPLAGHAVQFEIEVLEIGTP